MRYRTHQVKTQKTQRFVVNLFQSFLGYKLLNEINFTNTQALPAWLDHSRLSGATYWNNLGLLTEVGSGVPRFEHAFDGFNWNPEGLLIEKQSTNLVSNSMALGNLSVFNGVRALGDTYSDLQGYTITSNNGSVTSRITQTLSTQAWQPFIAVSSIVKNGDSKGAMLIGSGGPRTHYAYADLTARTVSPKFTIDQPTYIQGEVRSLSKDRYSINAVFDISTEGESTAGGAGVGAGSTVNGLITTAYALQLEQAKYASSFIKTGSSAVTRAADKLQLKATNYFGSVLIRYKRQDNGLIETKWIDYSGVTNPNLADQLPVGSWIKSIKQFSRVLKGNEKQFEDFYSNVLVDFNALVSSSLPSVLTLSRLSQGTAFSSAGLLTSYGSNVPRFDYDYNGNNFRNKGLLVEKQKTNFILNQYQFDTMSKANATVTVLSETLADSSTNDLKYRRIVGNRIDNVLDRTLDNAGGFISNTGTDLYLSAILRKGSSNRGTFGFTLANATNDTIYPYLALGFENPDALTPLNSSTGAEVFVSSNKKPLGNNNWLYGIKLDVSKRPSAAIMRPYIGPFISAANQYIDALVWQSEVGYPSSFIFNPSYGVATRNPDNLQLNLINYTGSVRLVYQRQDTNAIETKWVDYKNQTNPLLSDQLEVGVWLRRVVVYNRVLTTKEKANA